jgi:predicted RNase H-like HicB family nuclease
MGPPGLLALRESSVRHRIAIHQSYEGLSASVPGLPGCWSRGETEAEAIAKTKEAIREHLAVVDEQLKGQDVREVDVLI